MEEVLLFLCFVIGASDSVSVVTAADAVKLFKFRKAGSLCVCSRVRWGSSSPAADVSSSTLYSETDLPLWGNVSLKCDAAFYSTIYPKWLFTGSLLKVVNKSEASVFYQSGGKMSKLTHPCVFHVSYNMILRVWYLTFKGLYAGGTNSQLKYVFITCIRVQYLVHSAVREQEFLTLKKNLQTQRTLLFMYSGTVGFRKMRLYLQQTYVMDTHSDSCQDEALPRLFPWPFLTWAI